MAILLAVALSSSSLLTSLSFEMRIPAAFIGKTVLNKPKISEKVIALTFDDGPSPFTTPSVLNALKKYKAKATFFVVGEMIPHREKILKRMIQEGHLVGNHTYTHPYHPSEEKARYEFMKTNEAIHKALGIYPTFFRPPGGFMDSWNAKVAKAEGMPSIIWTGDSYDTVTHDANRVYSNVINSSHPGAIVLMHDVKAHTASAVPRILANLSKQGYKFVTVPEMLRIWDAANAKAQATKLAQKGKAAVTKAS